MDFGLRGRIIVVTGGASGIGLAAALAAARQGAHVAICDIDAQAAQAAADLVRIERLLKVLGGYALIPSLKVIQAMQTGDAAWRRVRAPLAALDDERHAALALALAPLALDAATD